MTNTTIIERPTDVFAPVLKPLSSPPIVGCFALLVLLAIVSAITRRKPVLSDGRFASGSEVRKGRMLGLEQIARQVPEEAALNFGSLVLPNLQPAVAVAGRSRAGKTYSFISPGIDSAIEQGWTLMVLDVKGSLMKKHAAYAHKKGYEVYVFAPGFAYSDGLNFLDFLRDETDANGALEIATAFKSNFEKRGAQDDGFFGEQGDSLLKTAFMLAKESVHRDLLSAWKILSLTDLARRLDAAKKYDMFGTELGRWAGEAAVALRTVQHAEETATGIVSSAVVHFQRLFDPSLIPCLLKSTIPLDLSGKQIVFFQIDEQNEAATSPLVATAIHMLVKRNLNASVKRKNTLGLFLDEFPRTRFPDIEAWISLKAEYGMVCVLGYQSNAQLAMRYSQEEAISILSSCGTTVVFNTGHAETSEKVSTSLGKKDVWYTTTSMSYGKGNRQSTRTEHVQQVPLISGAEIDRMGTGECLIITPGFNFRPYKLRVPRNRRKEKMWRSCTKAWERNVCPFLIKETKQRMDGISIEVELSNREAFAEWMLPTAIELEALKKLYELRARSGTAA